MHKNIKSWIVIAIALIVTIFLLYKITEKRVFNTFIQPSAEEPQTTFEQVHTQKSESIEIGRSMRGVPILANIHGDGIKCVIIFGGIHGDEPSSVELVKSLDLSFRKDSVPSQISLVIVSVVNPDGLALKTRMNAREVDINRNFPAKSWLPVAKEKRYYPGTHPASESETKAIIDLVYKFRPVLIISVHAPLKCVNWDGPAEDISYIMAEISGYPVKKYIEYDTPGSLGTYFGVERRIPTITFETSANESDAQYDKSIRALREAIFYIASK